MNSHYIYSFKFEERKQITSFVVIFFPLIDNPDNDLDDSIKDYFTTNSPNDVAILLFPDYQKDFFIEMVNSGVEAIKRLKNFSYSKSIKLISYDINGNVNDVPVVSKTPDKLDKKFISKLKEGGLYDIYKKRGGSLEADDTFHYILPSGGHSKLFLRIGNILTSGNEINFIAFCLLYFFDETVRYIYCDSASISSLAYSSVVLKSKIAKETKVRYNMPLIESFGGYEKLDHFIFKTDNCRILISTSTSGSLKKKITNDHKIDSENILTLFYNGDTKNDRNVLINLCDVNKSKHHNTYSKTFKNEIDCEYCNSNSIPVRLSGDQFLPAKSAIELVLIEKKHRPSWLNNFMKQFYGRKIIKCHYGNVSPKVREFYLDLEKVHEDINLDFEHDTIKENGKRQKSYATEFYKFLENNLPVTVKQIICLPDPASEQMSVQIQKYLKNKNIRTDIIHFDDFIKGTKKIDSNINGTILVVSSSIATGKKLYQLSLRFRDFQHISVFYFFGICRTPSKEVLETLTKDLEYRKDIINLNKLNYLENIFIPDRHTDLGKELENSPWEFEKRFLLEQLKPFFIKQKIGIELLDNRIKIINEAQSSLGLHDGLFFPSLKSSESLALRKQFAFFDFNYEIHGDKVFSQSDVYFTISSILHNLRNSNEDGRHLLFQHEHKRSLIAPQTFSRYSDGVIQACLLRGAQPGELNYSLDFNISYDMKKVLFSIFEDPKSDNSEALYEFLYSISISKLKLLKRDMNDFIKLVEVKYKGEKIVLGMSKFIKERFLA